MRYLTLSLTLLLAIASDVLAHENWCGYDFTQLSVPNAQGNVDDISLTDLNNLHQIVASDGLHSYLLDGGLFQEIISVPGSTGTLARNINNKGEIVGSTIIRSPGGSFTRPAFYRDDQGRYTTFTPPNAVRADAWGISNTGLIVGAYPDVV